MSLKYFHLFFIAVSIVMGAGVGIWAVDAYQANGQTQWLVLAGIGFGSAIGLIAYGNRFLHKVRKLGIAGLLVAGTFGLPSDALACPACAAGSTDSILRSGMNMGILALLGVTGVVLVSFAVFFVYLARRSRGVLGSGADVPASPFRVRVHQGSN
jgi:hypothetical protein